MEHLSREGKISITDFLDIIADFTAIVKKEPNVVKINDPVTVVGDIHGQFYDLIKIIEVGGSPLTNKYIFLGDYVDRGMFSTEVVIYLFSMKVSYFLSQIVYPKTVFMIRGNHECRQLTTYFNFKQECEIKYNSTIYEKIIDAFDALPLACVINDKFPCVHGGISSKIKTVSFFLN